MPEDESLIDHDQDQPRSKEQVLDLMSLALLTALRYSRGVALVNTKKRESARTS